MGLPDSTAPPSRRRQSVRSVEDGPALPAAAKFSEIHLADVFVSRAGDRWRYVHEWRTWYRWHEDADTRGWHEDRTGLLRHDVACLLRESMGWAEAHEINEALRRKVCSNGSASGVIALAGCHPDVAVSAVAWDADPMLLGVPGAIVDLRTGQSEPATPDVLVSRRCAVRPELGTPALWLSHLRRVMRGDEEMIGFLQRMFGYMLTGQVGEHALLFFFGTGRNGKGTIVETVVRLMGDYGYAAPVNLLMEAKNERHPTELMELRGRRLVSCSEPAQGARWDDGRIRSLTGGDTVTARKMGQDLSSFEPTHKLLIMGNHKPVLRSVDEAIKARFNVVDFSLTIPAEERDPHFLDKLREEWPQILQWMITGCLLWQEDGLCKPASMVMATNEYLEDEDSFGQFLAECCERRPDAFDPVSVLFSAYGAWCERVGERPMSRKSFRSVLHETPGIERKRGTVPECVAGVCVKENARVQRGFSAGAGGWLGED